VPAYAPARKGAGTRAREGAHDAAREACAAAAASSASDDARPHGRAYGPGMEWLALGVWLIVLVAALPLGAGAFAAPPLGLQPPLAIAGLVLAILFAIGGDAGLAWAAFGVGIAGTVTTGAGAAELIADEQDPSSRTAGRTAAFAGVALPMYATAAAVSLLAALEANGSL